METWKEFEANELTHSAAHHLLAIHEVGLEYGGWARVSDIARQLGITRGSVSINLRTLKKRGFLDTDERRLVKLSEKGQRAVQAVMAKKAVVKAFLREVLDVPELQAEIDSCKVEHLISQPTGEQLVHFMRFLVSEDPLARQVLARFKNFHDECPESKTCEVCNGHCLIEELQHARL
ncbi:MAG TPA: metal-dependent transcriptional regulator [Verrucomicrobiae bacterium]|nr:metal-dependent transcriptional regulator [Verrucomicrobiae bacterium]